VRSYCSKTCATSQLPTVSGQVISCINVASSA
jgi:hypothetical protein